MADSSPRFRHDLIANAVEVDGVRFIDVHDPRRGSTFRFYDFEYDLALQLDGRPHSDISAWAVATYGLDLTPVGIAEFATRLSELGFLEGPDGEPLPPSVVPGASDALSLSQVVNQTLIDGVPPPAVPRVSSTTMVITPAPARRPSSEYPLLASSGGRARTTPIGGVRPPPSGLLNLPRWGGDGDPSVTRVAGGRDSSPVALPVGETMVGFAAVKESVVGPPADAEGGEPSEAIGTVMGFAAVTDEQIREAELGAGRAPSLPPVTSERRAPPPPPPPTGERRMPPRPDTVVMAPFEAEEIRPRSGEPGLRRAPVSPSDRSTVVVVLVVAASVIAAVIGYYFWSQREAALEARRVQIISPRPAAVYRWFDAAGSAVVGGTASLSFAVAGSVLDVLPPGSRYAAGEIIAKLQGASTHEADVNHARSRLGYNQQIRDSMKEAGNLIEMRKAEIKIVEKQSQLDEAEAALDRLVIRASEAGEVVEVLAQKGALIEANVPAVRVQTRLLRGEFTLAAKDAEAAAHLGFCRVEIVGVAPAPLAPDAAVAATADGAAAPAAAANEGMAPRFADCRLTGAPPTPGERFEVELPAASGILLGQPLRLARVRYDGVFPVPRAVVVRVGGTDRIFVVGPGDTAQSRAITIADSDADEVVVSQGIEVGDRIIVDPPADLRDGSPLTILH